MTKQTKHKSNKIMKGLRKLTKCKTFKNKMYSILLTILGIITIPICDGNITAFVFILMISIPLFFEKDNCIM